ncbi:MAG TPA: hypothetical protein VHR17_08865 [Thermoanaerobaculia bacterium]|nr:hypothetical protein [Thermoanaerobaculia bacterium]
MRRSRAARRLTAWAVLSIAAAGVNGQELKPSYIFGVDYTFERVRATRKSGDTADPADITLVSYVYRPLRTDRHQVVVWSHGSTNSMAFPPGEPRGVPPTMIDFFTSRGYTLVAPSRRGVGESSGTYREECAVWAGKCTRAEYLELFESGLAEAVLDTSAVIDQNILGGLVPRDSRLLLAGQSRGGFLSLVMAAERPALVSGVVNFVGGWLSINDLWSAEDNEKALKLQLDRLSTIGARVRAPTVWLYAARDPFYAESTTRRFYRAFTEAGGKGEYFFVPTHTLKSGHELGSNPSLWERAVDEFLKSLQ